MQTAVSMWRNKWDPDAESGFDNPDFYHESDPEWDDRLMQEFDNTVMTQPVPQTDAYTPQLQGISNATVTSTVPPSNKATPLHIVECDAPEAKFYHVDPAMPVIQSNAKPGTDIPDLNFCSWNYATTQACLAQSDSAVSIYFDTGCIMTIIDEQFFLCYVPTGKILGCPTTRISE